MKHLTFLIVSLNVILLGFLIANQEIESCRVLRDNGELGNHRCEYVRVRLLH